MHVSRLQRTALDHLRRDLVAVTDEDGAEAPQPRALVEDASSVQTDAGLERHPPFHAVCEGARPALRWVPVDALSRRADQPRRTVSAEALAELTESIGRCGILQPLRVWERGDHRYQIIAGERRWSAARRLQLKEVPALVVQTNEEGAFIESLMENIQREALNPVDRARALQRLRVSLGSQSWEDVGRVIGITRRHVHNLLNVTRLPAEIQEDVRAGGLSEKHARALLLLGRSPVEQRRLWQRIISESVSGEHALELARSLRDSASAVPSSLPRVRAAIRTLTAFLSSEGTSKAATLTTELVALQSRIDETRCVARRSRRRPHLGPPGANPVLRVRPLAADGSSVPTDRGSEDGAGAAVVLPQAVRRTGHRRAS
jgi:ParB family chromosome partitioning protein